MAKTRQFNSPAGPLTSFASLLSTRVVTWFRACFSTWGGTSAVGIQIGSLDSLRLGVWGVLVAFPMEKH